MKTHSFSTYLANLSQPTPSSISTDYSKIFRDYDFDYLTDPGNNVNPLSKSTESTSEQNLLVDPNKVTDYNIPVPAKPRVSTSSSSSGTGTGLNTAKTYVPKTKSKGYNDFVRHFDSVVGKDATYGRYRNFLTRIAQQESGYNPLAKNKFAPAYGYFQFMQDGKKWNNIQHYSGLSIEAFQNDPEAQIRAGHKLAESFLKSFTPAELAEAKRQGFSEDAILAGCFMGGAGGVKKALKGIDTSDKHWDPEGKQGSSVLTYMHMFNK